MIEFEAWMLLVLPLLFAAGWFARGFESRVRAADEGPAPRSLFRGLNLLLNEQPDKAIDAFIEVVRLDPETIELHYALGNLFRRRGEFDRAIRIHTHLLNRADLPARERTTALAELGQDYLKSGMLDRAEDAYRRLLDDGTQRFAALRALLQIYAVEREWLKAIDCARRLEREAAESHAVQIAHFYCELTEQALVRKAFDAAQGHVDNALAAHRSSVRATVLAGEIAQQRGDAAAAVRLWLRVLDADFEYLPLVAERLSAAMDAAGRRDEALSLLRRALGDMPSIDLLDVTLRRVAEWDSPQAAAALLRQQLKQQPSLLGFERLLAARTADHIDAELEQLRALLATHTRRLARYRCSKCGFRAREFHWQCPGCTSWDSYPPRRIEELDVA